MSDNRAKQLEIENYKMKRKLDTLQEEINNLWNECENISHEQSCDTNKSGYCDCFRATFNSMLMLVKDIVNEDQP